MIPGRRRSHVLSIAILATPWLLAGPAQAACSGLNFSVSPASYTGSGSGYGVFDPTDRSQSVSFTVTRTAGSCSYFVAATTGSSGSFTTRTLSAGATLNYNLFPLPSSAVVLMDLPTATATNVISGSFSGGGGSTKTHTYQFDVPIQQVVVPGTYTDTVTFKLYTGTVASATLVKSTNVALSATVVATAEISVVATGGAFNTSSTSQTMNFGTLTSAASLNADVLARGNNGFDVFMQSANLGVLKLTPALDASTVPYSMKVNGSAVTLTGASPVNVASTPAKTALAGLRFPVQVTIGTVDPASAAGNYADTVTITVVSR